MATELEETVTVEQLVEEGLLKKVEQMAAELKEDVTAEQLADEEEEKQL